MRSRRTQHSSALRKRGAGVAAMHEVLARLLGLRRDHAFAFGALEIAVCLFA